MHQGITKGVVGVQRRIMTRVGKEGRGTIRVHNFVFMFVVYRQYKSSMPNKYDCGKVVKVFLFLIDVFIWFLFPVLLVVRRRFPL